jgi:hypothetical protein
MAMYMRVVSCFANHVVIPGRAARRGPGIHFAAERADEWIPGSRYARPGMTAVVG